MLAVSALWALPASYATFTAATSDTANGWRASTLQPPSGLAATQVCNGSTPSATLTWTATPSTYATGYTVQRVGGPTQSIGARATTTATDGPLQDGVTYTWTVAAVSSTWTSTTVSASLTPACAAGAVSGTGSVSTVGTSANGSVTVQAPAGVQPGDLMFMQAALSTTNSNLTAPSGWALVDAEVSSGMQSFVYDKVATSADTSGTSYVWTNSNSNANGAAAIVVYRGASQSAPIDVVSGAAGTGSQATAPSVTTTTANDVIIAFYATQNDGISTTPPPNMTQQYNGSVQSSAAMTVGVAAFDESRPTAGATGARTVALTLAPNHPWTAQLVAIKP